MEEGFAVCPYNPLHRIPKLRIQNHIVKCQVKYPDISICPYNATHRVCKAEIQEHMAKCPSKDKIFPDDKHVKPVASLNKPKAMLQKEYLPETDPNHEIWEEDDTFIIEV